MTVKLERRTSAEADAAAGAWSLTDEERCHASRDWNEKYAGRFAATSETNISLSASGSSSSSN